MDENIDDSEWDYQRPSFTDSFKLYLDEDKFTDIVFICSDNVKVKCHKAVLASSSDYLKRIFDDNGQKVVYINLPDFSETCLKTLLNVLYIGETVVSRANLNELQDITEFFEISIPNTVLSTAELAHFVELDANEKNCDFSFSTENLPKSKTVDVCGDDPLGFTGVITNDTLGNASRDAPVQNVRVTLPNTIQAIVKCENVEDTNGGATSVTNDGLLSDSQFASSCYGEADNGIWTESVNARNQFDNGLVLNRGLRDESFASIFSRTQVTNKCYDRVKKQQKVLHHNPFYRYEDHSESEDVFARVKISSIVSGAEAQAVTGFQTGIFIKELPFQEEYPNIVGDDPFQLYSEVEDGSNFYGNMPVTDNSVPMYNALSSEVSPVVFRKGGSEYNSDADTSATMTAGDCDMNYYSGMVDWPEEKNKNTSATVTSSGISDGIYPYADDMDKKYQLHTPEIKKKLYIYEENNDEKFSTYLARNDDNNLLNSRVEELIQQLSANKSTAVKKSKTPKKESVSESRQSNRALSQKNVTTKRVIKKGKRKLSSGKMYILKQQQRNLLEEFYKENKFPNRQIQENLAEYLCVSVESVIDWFNKKRFLANTGGQSWRGYKVIFTDALCEALEQMYKEDKSPDVGKLLTISERLNLPCRYVTEWFVNRQHLDEQGLEEQHGILSANSPRKLSLGHNVNSDSQRKAKSPMKAKRKRYRVSSKKSIIDVGRTSLKASYPYYSQRNLSAADRELLENLYQQGSINWIMRKDLCKELRVHPKVISDWLCYRRRKDERSLNGQSEMVPAENQGENQEESLEQADNCLPSTSYPEARDGDVRDRTPTRKRAISRKYSIQEGYESPLLNSGTVQCEICGTVRYYRFVKQARKFGIFCCESCRKFISKLIHNVKSKSVSILECNSGSGTCEIQPQYEKRKRKYDRERCNVCWLKLCLKNFHMKDDLRSCLSKYLPLEFRNENYLMSEETSAEEISKRYIKNRLSVETAPLKKFKTRLIQYKKNDNRSCNDNDVVKRIRRLKTARLIKKAAMNLSKAKAKQKKLQSHHILPVIKDCSVRLTPIKNPERYMSQNVTTSDPSSEDVTAVGAGIKRRATYRPLWRQLGLTRKYPTKLTKEQLTKLEHLYDICEFPSKDLIQKLSVKLGLTQTRISCWFSRRRYRDELKSCGKIKKKKKTDYIDKETREALEKSYATSRCPSEETKTKLAEQLNISVEKVTSWFRYRRYKDDKGYKGYKVIFNKPLEEALEALYKENRLADEEEQWKFAEKLSLPRIYVEQWFQKRQLVDKTDCQPLKKHDQSFEETSFEET